MNNQKKTLKLEWDEEYGAVYIMIENGVVSSSLELTPDVIVDYDMEGNIVGIDFQNIHTFVIEGDNED